MEKQKINVEEFKNYLNQILQNLANMKQNLTQQLEYLNIKLKFDEDEDKAKIEKEIKDLKDKIEEITLKQEDYEKKLKLYS